MLSAVTIYKEKKVFKLISLALILHQALYGCSKTLDPPLHCLFKSKLKAWVWFHGPTSTMVVVVRYNLTSTTSFYRVTSPYATGSLYSRAIGNSPAGFLESADIVVSQQLKTQVS